MAWSLLDFDALTSADLRDWQRVRATNPALDNPFFHPGFSRAVHAVFGDVEVATGGRREGLWFPVQISRGVARPVGWPGSDFQGPVTAPDADVDLVDMVRGVGLRSLRFEHFSARHAESAPWVGGSHPSPFIDATGGLDGYTPRLSKSGRDKMSRVRRMTNKAGRELGEVRLVWDSRDHGLLDELIAIKRAQYAATGGYDFFASPRRQQLIHHLLDVDDDGFGGILSAVYAGDHLLAAHFGLRDNGVLHWWFPVYERDRSEFAPGWVLLREAIAAAPANGLIRIDLGHGDEDYKQRAMTGAFELYEGEVTTNPLHRGVRHVQRVAIDRLKSSSLGPRLRAGRNRVMRLSEGAGQ